MIAQTQKLPAGLYFVATPIGAARDITLHALDILASADVLVAEDTRSLRRLMGIHGVPVDGRKVISHHDHSGAQSQAGILALIEQGHSVAYASEAGTPLIADPGFELSRAAAAAGHLVTAAPGACAVINALTLAGLPTDRFLFLGFLPNATQARRSALADVADVSASLVFYESPKRIAASLAAAADVLGADRPAALCREMTKKFEQVLRAPLGELAAQVAHTPPKGEIVVVIDRALAKTHTNESIEVALQNAMLTHSLKDASQLVAQAFGIPKRRVYQLALELDAGKTDE